MADSYVQLPTDSTGKKIDTRTEDVNAEHRQVFIIGDPSSNNAVASVQATDPSSNVEGLVVRDPNTTAVVSGLNSVRVRDIVTGTITTVATLTGITNTVAVYFDRGNPAMTVYGSQANTPLQTNTSGAIKVYDIVQGTITATNTGFNVNNSPTVTGITNTVAVYFDRGNPAITVYGSQANTPLQTNSSGAIKVYDISTGTIATVSTVSAVTNITNSVAVHVLSTNGTMAVNIGTIAGSAAVYFSPAKPIVLADSQHTASIFTVSGSTSGGTTSGVTLIAPSANYNFKIFAYSLMTTGIVNSVWTFTNGSGASPTELFRPLVTAGTPSGANLAVPPPSFLFATGTSTTLALRSDTGSLVHYSVSYIKESA